MGKKNRWIEKYVPMELQLQWVWRRRILLEERNKEFGWNEIKIPARKSRSVALRSFCKQEIQKYLTRNLGQILQPIHDKKSWSVGLVRFGLGDNFLTQYEAKESVALLLAIIKITKIWRQLLNCSEEKDIVKRAPLLLQHLQQINFQLLKSTFCQVTPPQIYGHSQNTFSTMKCFCFSPIFFRRLS